MVRYRKLTARSLADSCPEAGFTLAELLVAMAVLAVLMLLVTQMVSSTGKIWMETSAKIDSFQAARTGFQLLTDELRQATVNSYLDYFNSTGQTLAQYNATYYAGGSTAYTSTAQFLPVAYGRQSELHFISGLGSTLIPAGTLPNGAVTETQAVFFQCPAGFYNSSISAQLVSKSLNKLLNAAGFFIEFGAQNTVVNSPPSFLPPALKYRYRLMQLFETTEYLTVYDYPLIDTHPNDWFQVPLGTTKSAYSHSTTVRAVAANIIALVLWPKQTDSATDTLAPTYSYDSRNGGTAWNPTTTPKQPLQMNQMPPLIRVAMVALDEPSALVLQGTSTAEPPAVKAALAAINPNDVPPAPIFTVAANMDNDLAYLQTELNAIQPRVNSKLFSTTVSIRSAKFTQ